MATLSGRDASVKLGTYLIAEQGAWNMNLSADEIDTTVFGDTWGKTDIGMSKWSIDFNGFYDTDDTYQNDLIDALIANDGTLQSTIRLYVDNTSYWTPGTDVTSGGRITGITIGHDKAGVASISFTVSGSGSVTFI